MEFPHQELKAKSGSISGFIFENPSVGLKRGLFISIEVDFEPIKYGDNEWECSLASEWIPFKGNNWYELESIDFQDEFVKEMNETTFYLTTHDWCNDVHIELKREERNLFNLKLKANADFSGYYGGDENSSMPITVDLTVPFTNFIIRRDNLFPKPNSIEEALVVSNEFIDTTTFKEPSFDGEVFKFEPKS
ncbi:hypothetical protein [Alkalimarinus sediminis]|uniref:Uncharacterized protein n=1 Tax=Alkalimarinus sediminis TaxID=1632866 RepID=A0A9E8HL81_9ALTE|nr:hypothetical protein [Alkalimarinus sediminis]UZW76375.1 hypothetical protein NNL22_07250 [Alkalimarinus sediminis]